MTLHKHRILKKVGSPGETVEKTLVLVSDAVVTTDTRGNITRINPPAESLTGWMRGDVLGFDIFSIFELDQGKVLGLMDSVRNDSFERRTMLSWADGLSLKKKSGDKIPVSMNIGFIKGNKWEPDEFFFVIIPDDVKDENGECRLERYYRIVMDLMNNSVFMINSDMKIVVYNQAFLDLCANIGISLEKLDKPVYEILPSEIFGKKWDYQEIFDNGSSYRMERTYKNEKTVRYLTIETIPLSDNNSITHAAFIGSDTTREKEIEEKEERISMNFKAHSENVEEIADLCARIKMPLGKIRKISESSASADLKNISAAASEISEILLDIDLKWLKYEKIKTFFDLIKESSSGGEKKEEA
nr:PAS domain-containing protein [Methanomicrobium sp. W14]